MDKTNRSTRNTPTNTANAQPQSRPTTATVPQPAGTTVPSSSASLAQQASSLTSASGGNARAVQDAIVKKLDISCKILTSLLEKLPSDASAMARILRLLTQTDPNNPMSLMEQFTQSRHEAGTAFLRQFLGTLRPFLECALSQNLADPSIRKTVLDVLSLKTAGMPFMISFYRTSQKKDIDFIESVLIALIPSQSTEIYSGIFKLAQVFNKKTIPYIQDYVFGYCKALDYDAWSETSPEQFAFYFLYGFLGNSLDVLGCLFSCLEACPHIEFKVQAEQKISEFFGFFLKDLRKAYIKNDVIRAEDYDETILYVCQRMPKLVEKNLGDLFRFCERPISADAFVRLFPVKNSKGQVFLDLIYENKNAQLIGFVEANLVSSVETISNAGTIVQYLDLPHMLEYLRLGAKQPLEMFTKEERFRYLLLSLMIQDPVCVEHFKSLQIETEEETQRLKVSLLMLAEHVFGFYNISLIDFLSNYGLKNTPLKRRELFFEILEILKPFKVLEWLTFTPQLFAACLKQDYQMNLMSQSPQNFEYMLGGLQKIGFDLHYVDPDTSYNLVSAAYELERPSKNFPLFHKLLSLGCNPFLLQNDGMSVYSHLSSGRNDEKARAAAILKDLKLDKHPFLPLSFTKNILKNNRLDERDEQGRTPLMLYVMVNLDIKDFFGGSALPNLQVKHLEAKDHKDWTVFDYAEHNKDQRTLKLLNDRKKALEQKAKKLGVFAKAAQVFNSKTPKAQNVEASTPKTPPAPSSNSKRKQARKLKAKEGGNPENLASTQEITIDYNPETGTSTTSIKAVHNQAAETIAKEEAKAAAKQKKKEGKEKTPQNIDKKEGLLAKAKKKIKAVATTLETAKNLAANPQSFVQALASKLNQPKTGERLASGQRFYNIGKAKPLDRLEDGFWLSNSATLTDLANEAIGQGKLEILPAVIKILEAVDEATQGNSYLKIDRMKVLQAFQWIVGGKIEYGKGSHLNLRYAGGVFTIPQNKDGSDNADIFYVKKAAALMTQQLRSLLLGYEASQSTLSSEDSSEIDEWKLSSSSETSFNEEVEDETPEPSESEESKD